MAPLHKSNGTELSSAFSTPVSGHPSHAQNMSLGSTLLGDGVSGESPTTIEQSRKPPSTSRTRKTDGHQPSHSRNYSEARTPGEYALHHLLNSFVAAADQKINQCIASIDELVTPVEQICGPDVDPSFDQLISALGHIARQKPKPLIDSLMFWRKAKGEAASLARQSINLPRGGQPVTNALATLLRRNTEPVHPGDPVSLSIDTDQPQLPTAETSLEDAHLAEKRATVSIYLVCRVLIEVFDQSTLDAITLDLAGRLEEIVFGQLKSVDPTQIPSSSLRLANWRIYSQLLGIMSRVDFVGVTRKFVSELEICQTETGKNVAGLQREAAEGRAELLILGMRHLHIRTVPGAGWEESCDFLRVVSRLFVNCHGQRIKQAYCQVLEKLLLPVAACTEPDLNAPKWKELLELMNSRLGQMLTKIRHWSSSFPLSVLMLCVSPRETFLTHWSSYISNMGQKLKDRATRGLVLQAICRLTWSYLYRHGDQVGQSMRKVEEIVKLTLPQGRKTHLSTESYVVEPMIQLIRIIGFRYQELCFRTVIFPLLNSEIFTSGKDLRIEQMEPEKVVIGIRAFLIIMSDLEKGEAGRPPFMQSFAAPAFVESLPVSPMLIKPQLLAEPRTKASIQDDVLSRPVNISQFGNEAKQYYHRFCEILGKITILCDNTFGGQATLTEKLSGQYPKTPLQEAFTFSRTNDGSIQDSRQAYYDLLHVAIQALPRCLSEHVPFKSLINLLCTGSAHIQTNIAKSSAQSLKSIARHSQAQKVATGFPKFIFSYDSKYSTMSDEGMLGPGHIERTLTLYTELLQIWIEELNRRTKPLAESMLGRSRSSSNRGAKLELTVVSPHVDDIEAYGLFFLCSQSRRVRAFAIKVLRMVLDFDRALDKDEQTRIIRILEEESHKVLDLNDDNLTVAERSRLQKGKRKSAGQNTLIEICSSEVSYDSTLWFKVFPNLISIIFETCPNAIALSRGIICERLNQMQASIELLAEASRPVPQSTQDLRVPGRNASTPPEILIDQWKLYLVMACVTLNSAGAQSQSQLANATHSRKPSKGASYSPEKMSSARSLFSSIIPLLSVGRDSVRGAIVVALGSINRKVYRTLLESLQYAVTMCNDEAKARIATHQRTPSSPMRSRKTDRLRTEVTHVYKLTSVFLTYPDVYVDEWIINNLVTYTKDLRLFLSDAEVQTDWEFQRLRFHYCGLMEEVFEGVNRAKNASRWIPFESRKSAFTLMEEWCGYSPNQRASGHRDDPLHQYGLNHHHDGPERATVSAAREIEKKNLRIAALSAMASLCAGPVSIRTESRNVLSFQLPRILSWIESIFATVSDKMHLIGRQALKNLIVHNKDYPSIMEHAIECCYRSEKPKALESYFRVVTEVLIEIKDYPLAFWRILGAVLFTLGNESRDIRMKSATLLRTLEERQQKSSKLQDFDISISDKTTAVYKLAQFEYSKRLSKAHSELAFTIFSEFSLHFRNVKTDHQRNMVAAILPWIQTIELQLDPAGGPKSPTAVSYMLLSNLLEITIRSSNILHNEVQALWQALATGPHGGNVQLILDFIISLSLERREQNFVDYAKQIVVHLAATPAGSRVIDFLLLQLVPKNMVNEKRLERATPDMKGLPYVADLSSILPMGNKQAGLSLGQISMIFLVDLMVAPVALKTEAAIKLVHAVLILWDHYTPSVQEQAREMLVHLVHELVTSKVPDAELHPKKQKIEQLVEDIRTNAPNVIWTYEDCNGKDDDDGATRVPSAMTFLTNEIVTLFSLTYDNFSDAWAKEALSWASICPVRHLACRSFQVFRCISSTLDTRMMADMLARLSNTIADEQTDYQAFSMEILTTLKVIIGSLQPADILHYPQLFWTTCACLNTIHEREFSESLAMLEKLLSRLSIGDPEVVKALMAAKPSKWEGEFDGVQSLIYKGLKSADSLERTISVIHQLSGLPSNSLVGDDTRLLFSLLANMPQFLHQFDLEVRDPIVTDRALQLADVSDYQGLSSITKCLAAFANEQYSSARNFRASLVASLKETFFAEYDGTILVFMMGFLTNRNPWFRLKTMDMLCAIIPEVDMRKPDVACHGPDLISPLLRLLQTDLCPQALEVMDNIMEVSGNPMEKHHIRMSLASGSAKAIRKEYERTQSLYGIPLPSGWSIPMPAYYSGLTRSNVHAVFYTCGETESMQTQERSTPDVEFRNDEGYFPTARTATMKSVDTVTDANMGDLVHKLDSLDDFFDEPDSMLTPDDQSSNMTAFITSDFQEHGTNVYDQQTAPILRKSLGRTNSTSSFHNGLAESRPQTSHLVTPQNTAMTPAAFATTAVSQAITPVVNNAAISHELGPRPLLHSRSITSPVNTFAYQPTPPLPSLVNGGSFLSEPDSDACDDAVVSDNENSPFPSVSNYTVLPGSYLSGPGPGVVTPGKGDNAGAFTFEGMRRGMRRLTGGARGVDKERERVKEIARMRAMSSAQSGISTGASPRVPTVPAQYLTSAGNANSPAASPGI